MKYIVMSQYHSYGDVDTRLRRVECDNLNNLMLDIFIQDEIEDKELRENLVNLRGEELIQYVRENLLDVDNEYTLTVYEEESLKIILEKS